MTKEEFVARHRATWRERVIANGLVGALFMVPILVTSLLLDWLKSHDFIMSKPVLYGYVSFLVFYAVGISVSIMLLSRRERRKRALCCPGCGKSLAQVATQVTMTRIHCKECGKLLFDG